MIFQVSGRGPFPIDMLRFDRCSPASECDSQQIARTFGRGSYERGEQVVVNLFRSGDVPPARARWQGFGWTVAPEGQEREFVCR